MLASSRMSEQIDLDTGFTHTSFFHAWQLYWSVWNKEKKEKKNIASIISFESFVSDTKWNISNTKKI